MADPRAGYVPSVWTLCGGVLVGLVAWFFGTDVAHAVMVGIVATVAALVWAAVPPVRDVPWEDPQRDSDDGARHDVVRLSEALRPRFGRVRTTALRPVRELAARRLALHHLDLDLLQDRVAIERLIGTAAYGVLCAGLRRPPRLRSLLRCLDTLDALDASDTRDLSGSTLGSRHDR